MPVIPYAPQTWADTSGGGTPTSAARFNVQEAGILAAHFMPAVAVTHNAAQTATTAVEKILAFNTERFDQASNAADTMHDTVTNNSRLTCRYAGVYQITGNIEWASNATGLRDVYIKLNGTSIIAYQRESNASVANTIQQCVTRLWSLAVNDYVELAAFQTSGGNLNVNATSAYSPEFMMVRVA